MWAWLCGRESSQLVRRFAQLCPSCSRQHTKTQKHIHRHIYTDTYTYIYTDTYTQRAYIHLNISYTHMHIKSGFVLIFLAESACPTVVFLLHLLQQELLQASARYCKYHTGRCIRYHTGRYRKYHTAEYCKYHTGRYRKYHTTRYSKYHTSQILQISY